MRNGASHKCNMQFQENQGSSLHSGFPKVYTILFVCLFVALHPKSTAMVMAGRSVHLTTLSPGQA